MNRLFLDRRVLVALTLFVPLSVALLLQDRSGAATHAASAAPATAAAQAAAPAAPPIVAAAPGWVDVQDGTRRLGMKADGVVVAAAPVAGAEPVAAGTELLRLDDRALKLDQQANALDLRRQQATEKNLVEQLKQAREELVRLQDLVRIQAEPVDVARQAQAQARSLEAALDAARLDIESTRLREQVLELEGRNLLLLAPTRGRVLRLDVHEGETVSRGTPVVWFAPDAPLVVRAELDERLFSKVKPGMRAEVEAEGGDGRVFTATLLSVAPHVGPVRSLPEMRAAGTDDRVVECVLALRESGLLIGQRVIVRIRGLT